MADRRPVLEVRHLHVRYGASVVLDDVSLDVRPGEIVGLIGESGSGKTTFARTVLGLVPASSGAVLVGGEDITAHRPRAQREFRRRGVVQYVFQDPLRSLDARFTVRRSVAEGLVYSGRTTAEATRATEDALASVGLAPHLWDRVPGELSGGQRQRVAIARALAVGPELLLCDEPVSALDASSRIEVLDTLVATARDRGTGILLISHDLGSLAGVADRVAVLNRGSIVEHGPTASVLGTPQHPYTQALVAAVPTIGEAPPEPELQRIHPQRSNVLPSRETATESVAMGESVAEAPSGREQPAGHASQPAPLTEPHPDPAPDHTEGART